MSGNPCVSVGRAGVVLVLLMASVTPALAQNAPNQAAQQQAAAAAAQQLNLVLEQWHQASLQVQVLNGEHRRYVYD